MSKIGKYFVNGLLVLVPIVVTLYIVYFVFVKIDGLLRLPIPGVGFVATILLVLFIGFLATRVFMRRLLDFVDRTFTRLPLLKLLYSSIKDLVGAFVGEKKSFTKPVLVTYIPDSDAKAIGFVSREDLEFLGLEDQVAVYFPESYNFAGNIFIFPKERVTPLEAPAPEVLAFLISGGVAGK